MHFSPNSILGSSEEDKIGWECNMHGIQEKYMHNVGVKTWWKPLGRPRCEWDDNVKMD